MCRFYWGDDYVQNNISGQSENVSGHFVDVLDKLRRIVKHSNGSPSMVDAYGNNVDGTFIPELYQGLEARTRNSRENPALGKLVDVIQAVIQRTREALDKVSPALLTN